MFALLLWRLMRIARQARDTFGMLIVTGVTAMILFQVLINIGMNLRLMPVTGIPLPFISYGGSSLLTMLLGIGLAESVGCATRRSGLMNSRSSRTAIVNEKMTVVPARHAGALLLPAAAPGRLPTPAAAPTAPPTPPHRHPPIPAGWVEHAAASLSIPLPSIGRSLDFSGGDLRRIFADLQAPNPELAAIIGGAEALQGAAFWAFHRRSPRRLRRQPEHPPQARSTAAVEDMQAVVDPVVAQYRSSASGTETPSRPGDRRPARRVTSPTACLDRPTAAPAGTAINTWCAAPRPWILSYSAVPPRPPRRLAGERAVFESE